MRRRSLLLGSLAAAPFALPAQSRSPTGGPLRLGADSALVDSGLARSLQRPFGLSTGIPVLLISRPALSLLDALVAGELDAGLVNAPEAEAGFEKQGLVHDRRPIASGGFVIVGPMLAGPTPRDPARLAGSPHASAAFTRLSTSAALDPDFPGFVSAGDGSGAHVVEQATWQLARIAPQLPWYSQVPAGTHVIAHARARGAYALVERADWIAHGGAPLVVLVEDVDGLAERVHAMRSFRSPHPAGKLFMSWIVGPRGRAIVARHRGYGPLSG